MPTWLQNKQIVITRTVNGWAIGPDKGSLPEQCVTFDSWTDVSYWLDSNWANPPAP